MVDLYYRNHLEGGEDAPIFCLQLTHEPASHQRLVTYLQMHREGMGLLAQINAVLTATNEACPAVPVPKVKVKSTAR